MPQLVKPRLVGVAQAASILGIGRTKTYELISEQLLDTVTIGTRRLVTVESIDRLIAQANTDQAA